MSKSTLLWCLEKILIFVDVISAWGFWVRPWILRIPNLPDDFEDFCQSHLKGQVRRKTVCLNCQYVKVEILIDTKDIMVRKKNNQVTMLDVKCLHEKAITWSKEHKGAVWWKSADLCSLMWRKFFSWWNSLLFSVEQWPSWLVDCFSFTIFFIL